MATQNVLILGAGPAGMSAALALAIQAAGEATKPLKITLFELRPELQTIGGTINLTPLAMKYLDYIGAGKHLRQRCIDLNHGLDYISLRTGKIMGNLWGNIGATRVARHVLVESLLKTIQEEHAKDIDIQWGKKVTEIAEGKDKVVLTFQDGTSSEGDALIGADGIHSLARRLWVEPERKSEYAGRVVVMGFSDNYKAKTDTPPLVMPDGSPALVDTCMLSATDGLLLASYWEPTRSNVYFAHISYMDAPHGDESREGWKALAEDQDGLKKNIRTAYSVSKVEGIPELVGTCDKWHFWPINILPGGGRWYKRRVLLIGDAAHAMPPQGESTGFAIEDGILVAHVFSRRDLRSVEEMFQDFQSLRKAVIDKHYADAIWSMNNGFRKRGWLMSIVAEYMIWVVLLYRHWNQGSHFSGDMLLLINRSGYLAMMHGEIEDM